MKKNRVKEWLSKINWLVFIICLAIPVLGGWLIGTLISSQAEWLYPQLVKPPFSPPSWLFPLVWTILYSLMGVASYIIWQTCPEGRKPALILYGIQLACNFLWPIIFFQFQNYWLAALDAVILLILIGMCIAAYEKCSHVAAWLMVPSFLWAAFACYLTIAVALLN